MELAAERAGTDRKIVRTDYGYEKEEMGKFKTHKMKEEYIHKAKAKAKKEEKARAEAKAKRKPALLCGPYGRGAPGQEKVSAGYPHPTAFLPAGTSRGQPPPGKKIVIRGREPCGAIGPNGIGPNAVPVGVHGTRRFSTLSPREYPGQAGFTEVQKMNVGGRKKDLSACAPDSYRDDNVWVQDEEAFRHTGNNFWVREVGLPGLAATHPNAVRFATLTPREYPGQAGFTEVRKLNVGGNKKDLSACAPDSYRDDNVWVWNDNSCGVKIPVRSGKLEAGRPRLGIQPGKRGRSSLGTRNSEQLFIIGKTKNELKRV